MMNGSAWDVDSLDDRVGQMVSIIVPVYNCEKYLRQCIDSLLNQSYRDLEIICVDDGSTDDSLNILHEYSDRDSRIIILNKINDGKGAAGARNLGLESATGEYVIFLDSDDFFEPDMIEKMVSAAEENNADIVLCRAERFDDRTGKRERDYEGINFKLLLEQPVFSYKDCKDTIFQIADWIVWNKLFRRELITANNLRFESIPISDDQYIPALGLVLAERITSVDEVFVHYRVNTGTSQVDKQAKHPEASYLATYSVVEKMNGIGVYEDVKKSYLNNVIRVFREYFDRMTEYEVLSDLYHRFREVEFPRLGAEGLDDDFFYDKRLATWYSMITSMPLEDILLSSARAHGDRMTTAILRFQVPYIEIVPGSKIVLVGKGRIGKYWYSQLILSDYCDVVAWVANENEIAADLEFNQILVAR